MAAYFAFVPPRKTIQKGEKRYAFGSKIEQLGEAKGLTLRAAAAKPIPQYAANCRPVILFV